MASKKGFCKLHHREEPLVKAHVVPRGFFPGTRDADDVSPKTYSGRVVEDEIVEVVRKRTRIGWYDSELVCLDAERLFQVWDDYAIKVLRRRPKRKEWVLEKDGLIAKVDGHKLAYCFADIHYTKLKSFFLSLLWRAGSSTREVFSGISLGSREEELRQMILSKNPGGSDNFSVLVMRFTESANRSGIMFHPAEQLIEGVSFARFIFGGFMIEIKIDNAKTLGDLREFQLSPHRGLIVIQTRFDGSQLHSVAKELVSHFKAA